MEKKKSDWRECRTAHELGDLERPSILEWFRHLAGIPEAPVLAAETD